MKHQAPNPNRPERKAFIFCGWYIVGTGIIANALGYGSRYSFAAIFPSLLEEFKWSRDVTAAILSIHILIYGFGAPLAGYLVDRMGPRRTMALGATLLALGLALSGQASNLWHFYLSFGVLSGIGLSMTGAVPLNTTLRNWFEKRRGLALSVMSLGYSLAHTFYFVVAWLTYHIGWRNTFVVEALVVFGAMIPLFIFVVRYHPQEKGLFKDGAPTEENPEIEKETSPLPNSEKLRDDWSFPKALLKPRFWMLALVTFCLWGVMDHLMVAHQIAFAIDAGYSKMYASSVLSLYGLSRCCGSFFSLVSDRIGRELTVTIGTILGTSAILVLMSIQDASQPWKLYYYTLIQGLGVGFSSTTITASIADIVRGPQVGLIFGLLWFSFSLGGSVGPWLGGWLFEMSGHYRIAFAVAIMMFILGLLFLWLAAPRKSRRARV